MLSADSHLPPSLTQDTVRRMQSQWWTGNNLECQYSAVRARAVLPFQVLINEIFSLLRLSCDIVESEVDSSWRQSIGSEGIAIGVFSEIKTCLSAEVAYCSAGVTG